MFLGELGKKCRLGNQAVSSASDSLYFYILQVRAAETFFLLDFRQKVLLIPPEES